MKKLRKLKALIITLLILITLIPGSMLILFAAENNHTGYTAWTSTDSLPASADNYYLTGNAADSGTYKVVVNATLKDGVTVSTESDTASDEKAQTVTMRRISNTLSYDAPGSHYSGGGKITGSSEDECEGTIKDNCPSLKFMDLNLKAWYHPDTDYVIENGLMNGTGEDVFAPGEKLTRAMLVTVLYRLEGEPVYGQGKSGTFGDVADYQWYTEAVEWAAANGIVEGYGDAQQSFGPDYAVTREQIAAIMHRYSVYKGYDVSAGENTNILSYEDFDEISEYAIGSLQWAVGSVLLKGRTESTLNPADSATRAEFAAIFRRFIESNI